jgi:hypothetical protein
MIGMNLPRKHENTEEIALLLMCSVGVYRALALRPAAPISRRWRRFCVEGER